MIVHDMLRELNIIYEDSARDQRVLMSIPASLSEPLQPMKKSKKQQDNKNQRITKNQKQSTRASERKGLSEGPFRRSEASDSSAVADAAQGPSVAKASTIHSEFATNRHFELAKFHPVHPDFCMADDPGRPTRVHNDFCPQPLTVLTMPASVRRMTGASLLLILILALADITLGDVVLGKLLISSTNTSEESIVSDYIGSLPLGRSRPSNSLQIFVSLF
ncbi:hypothetical protein V1504DRAFT_471835 [Lipomyces starkeyi]